MVYWYYLSNKHDPFPKWVKLKTKDRHADRRLRVRRAGVDHTQWVITFPPINHKKLCSNMRREKEGEGERGGRKLS